MAGRCATIRGGKSRPLLLSKKRHAAFSRRIRCASCLAARRAAATLHRRGITIPAPFQARQSCRFLENGLLFPSQTALHRFPLRAKCFLPRAGRGRKRIISLSRLRTRNSVRLSDRLRTTPRGRSVFCCAKVQQKLKCALSSPLWGNRKGCTKDSCVGICADLRCGARA